MVSGVGLPVKPAATLAIRRGTMLTLITAIGTLPTRYNFESILCMKDKRSGRFDAKKCVCWLFRSPPQHGGSTYSADDPHCANST